MADIGGYPIHDYGTTPILKSFMHSLDWDERRKEAERKAEQDVLKNTRELGESLSTTGDLTSEGLSTYLKSGGQLGMISSLLQRNERAKKIKEAEYQSKIVATQKESAAVAGVWADSLTKVMTTLTNYGEGQEKLRKNLEQMQVRGLATPEQINAVNEQTMNTILPMFQKLGLNPAYEPIIKDSIIKGNINQAVQTIYGLEIAENSAIIQDPKTLIDQKTAAHKKNLVLVSMSERKPEELNLLIKVENDAYTAALKDALNPPKPTVTDQDKAISDFLIAEGKDPKNAVDRNWGREQLKLRSLKPEADKVHEIKISQLVEQYPSLSRQDATGIILGTIKIKEDPVSGTMYITDLVKGTQKPLIEVGMTTPKEPSAKPVNKTIWDLSGKSTGIVSAAKAAGSIVTGTVGLPVAEDTLYARQYVQGAQNDLIRSLSINPRFPVGEMERIKEEVNLAPTVFDNPPMMRQRILAINDYLSKRVENEEVAAKDPSLGVEARKNARTAAKDINNFLKILGAPKVTRTKEEYDALPAGAEYIKDGQVFRKGKR